MLLFVVFLNEPVRLFSLLTSCPVVCVSGSAVFNVLFVIGMCAVFSHEVLELTWWPLFRDSLYYLVSLVALVACFWDQEITWYEASILFAMYFGYVTLMAYNERLYNWVQAKRGARPDLHGAEVHETVIVTSAGETGQPLPPAGEVVKDAVDVLSVPHTFRVGVLRMMLAEVDGKGKGPAKHKEKRFQRAQQLVLQNIRLRRRLQHTADMSMADAAVAATNQVIQQHRRDGMPAATASPAPTPGQGVGEGVVSTGVVSTGAVAPVAPVTDVVMTDVVDGMDSQGEVKTQDEPSGHDGVTPAVHPAVASVQAEAPPSPSVSPDVNAPQASLDQVGFGSGFVPTEGAAGADRTSAAGSGGDDDVVAVSNADAPTPTPTPDGPKPMFDTASGAATAPEPQFAEQHAHQQHPHRKISFHSAGSHTSIVSLKDLPQGDASEDAAEDEAYDIGWPTNGTLVMKITYVIMAPLTYTLWLTIPDVRKSRWENWFVVSFFSSILWIGVFSYFMVRALRGLWVCGEGLLGVTTVTRWMGLLGVATVTRWMCMQVWWATLIGVVVGIPDPVMGLTFLAAGTSIPDLLSSVIVARQGAGDMAVSSSIGSNIFDVLVGLPLPWICATIVYNEPVTVRTRVAGCDFASATLICVHNVPG